MTSEWPIKHLSQVAEVITGFPFKGEDYLPPHRGVRVVRGDNVTERYVRWGEKEKCWSEVTQALRPYVLRTGDIVIGMDGSKVGRNFAAIGSEDTGTLLAQRVARVRAREGVSQDFVRYAICNPSFTDYVKAVHTGTSIPHISKGQIEKFEISVPPLQTQISIAAILSALDDRIKLLRETNTMGAGGRSPAVAYNTGDSQTVASTADFAPAEYRVQPVSQYQAGYAQHLRDALPNATFVAFTGTPVSSTDRDTRSVFGDYIHVYDMQQAQEDGATVAIYYESRLAKLGLNEAELSHLDDEVDELAEDEEESQQAKLKSRWAALEKVVGAEPRIARVAADLVAHFEERNNVQDGKAMVVAMSREICVHLYNEITRLRPDWHSDDPEQGAIKIVMTGSASDKALLRPHIHSGQVKKRLEKRFKDPQDPLKLVIVRDMWLTGFDAPCVHTLYVDKPMKGHNLMQAIARVNRVFKDKQGGLVVDYIGIGEDLKAAMKEYTASKGRGKPTVDAREALAVMLEKLDVLRAMLHGFDYSGFLTGGHKTLAGAANHVLGLKSDKERDGKKRFADHALAMSHAFSLCCTLPEAKAHRDEVAFMQAVKVILTKREASAQRKTDEQRDLAIRQIISSAVVSGEVVDIFAAVGLDKPNIGLLDDDFLAQVHNLPEKNLAVELLERLLQGEIKSRFASNVVQDRKFSDLLADVIRRYQNRSIETAQVMEELIAMAKKFREAAGRGEQLGLREDEVKFYDALANNESAVRELQDETLKKIAQELTQNLRDNLSVDWSERESVRAKLRLMVKRILRKYKYPPDQADAAVELVLEQAQSLGDEWAF